MSYELVNGICYSGPHVGGGEARGKVKLEKASRMEAEIYTHACVNGVEKKCFACFQIQNNWQNIVIEA